MVAHFQTDPLRAVFFDSLINRKVFVLSLLLCVNETHADTLTSSTDEAMAQATGFPPNVLK